ncbi:MAG: biotin--[acetyl-CoA-carboxylase] ligase [Gammaproteobacteria bacterium]|nr:biotin--[acetyl-CoA-carboxylase] ligase [Gammaproteobacteria bacterium]
MNSAESLDLLKIRSQLGRDRLYQPDDLVIFDCIDSTNEWALSQCCKDVNLPRACFAEQQVKGRGRKDRIWYSPYAQNIYMSLVREFNTQITQLSGLSMVVGICIVRTLSDFGIKAGLKWPNDVYIGLAKVAGILIETRIKPGTNGCAVIGVGLNYDMADVSSAQIETPWTDLLKEAGDNCKLDRNLVAGKMLNEIMSGCDFFEESGFEGFRDEWTRYDLCVGKMLDIHHDKGVSRGQYLGINENGALMAQVDGCQKVFYAADVSIRMKK